MDIRYGRKRSGIKRELVKKIKAWLDSITDEAVRTAASKDVIVTGGAIASMLLGEQVNDFDLYFRTKGTTMMVANYYVKQFIENKSLEVAKGVTPYRPEVREETIANIKGEEEDRIIIFMKSAGIASESQGEYNYFETMGADAAVDFAEEAIQEVAADGDKYRPVFLSQNAITLSHKVQLVIRFYGEPDEIHNNYDFIHATCFFDFHNSNLEFPADAMEALLCRTLIYHGSLYPVASIFRVKKFVERGWRITAGQQLKIMWQISEIDLTDFTTLQEQLTGVDMAYMHELIEALKDVDPSKVNSSYVGAIIDRIFD